ncbi:MAG: hypothetical protein SAK29_20265, partial [Scytonema sp. PMC 1069.18]|nr:hypothetical protein [Scytonema sp. PMC 1069.18]
MYCEYKDSSLPQEPKIPVSIKPPEHLRQQSPDRALLTLKILGKICIKFSFKRQFLRNLYIHLPRIPLK